MISSSPPYLWKSQAVHDFFFTTLLVEKSKYCRPLLGLFYVWLAKVTLAKKIDFVGCHNFFNKIACVLGTPILSIGHCSIQIGEELIYFSWSQPMNLVLNTIDQSW